MAGSNDLQKGARPIFDNDIYEYVKSVSADCWNEPTTIMSFTDKEAFKTLYKAHISAYKHSQLVGLEQYTNTYITDGVTGAFLDWYSTYGIKNIYVLKGEYPFHARNGCNVVDSVYDVPSYKTMIISLPFSATGNVHDNFYEILQVCVERSIKLLIDSAYLNISAIGEVNIECEAIESVATSLSKVFATGMNKIGIMFNKHEIDTPVKQLDEWHYLNHHSMILHTKLLNKFDICYVYDKYSSRYQEMCNSYGLQKCNTLLFGLSNDSIWSEFNRDNIINRICISKILQY